MNTAGLRFEHRVAGEPALGIGTTTPRLSWYVQAAPDGFAQSSAQVEIARTPWGGEPRTETITLEGRDQVLVAWPGAPLASRERAEVRVRVRSVDAPWGDWGQPAVVEAGPLAASDWAGAQFISPVGIGGVDDPAPALSRTVPIEGGVRTARLHITAHGWYEARINGRKVGEDWFGPGWTAYDKRLRYYTYDITELLSDGDNTVEILLGNGWYRSLLTWELKRCYGDRLAALALVEVVCADGTTMSYGTDDAWRAHETNIVANELYAGESQDLRRPTTTGDHPVEPVEGALERLVAAAGPAVRVTDVLPAQRVWRSPSGRLLVDFGQNAVGFTRLTVRGLSAGSVVTVRHAEVLEHDELGTRPLRHATATDRYTLAGPSAQTLQPHFTFHGFRYAEVDGVEDLDPSDIVSVVTGSAMTRTGWFSCSDPLLNQLHSNIVWGMKGNFVDIPTDCPQRDERLGWTGDVQVFSPTALFLHDAAGFLTSWCADLAAEQLGDGTVPIVIPNVLHGGFGELPAAAWGDAAVVVPWNVYRSTGDEQVLRHQLPSMKAWVDRVSRVAANHLWTGQFQFGDWLDPDAPPDKPADAKAHPDVVATACFYRSADLLARACAVLGDDAGAASYRALADAVAAAFQNRVVTPDGIIHSDAATVYAQAIMWGLLDDRQRTYAGNRLADLARVASFRVSTGFVGTPLICEALSETGHADIAYLLLTERDCPSWLYSVTMGATTIWERWDSMLPDGSINPGEMTSFNHYALGAVASWMHRDVGGLAFDPLARTVTVAPIPGRQLEHASSRLLTPYGEAASSWRRDGDTVVVEAQVPHGLVGHVVLPDGARHTVASGAHTFTVATPDEAPPPATIRELLSSRAWPSLSPTLLDLLPMPTQQAMTGSLEQVLGSPVHEIGMALTMGGMFGPADDVQRLVDDALASGWPAEPADRRPSGRVSPGVRP